MLTPREVQLELIKLQIPLCKENAHERADYLLCELIKSLGYKEIVEEYNLIIKGYDING